MCDNQCSGCLSMATVDEKVCPTDVIICKNRCISLEVLDKELDVSAESAHTNVTGFSSVTKWGTPKLSQKMFI